MGTYRITAKMLDAGAAALDQCRAEPDHTPRTVCESIFIAMLNAADSHPGTSLPASFRWSPHDDTRLFLRKDGKVDRRKPGKLTRADFDAEGVRRDANGRIIGLLQDYWYIPQDEITKA